MPSLQARQVTTTALDEVVTKATKASSMKGNPLELTAEERHGMLVKAL